MNTEVVDSRRVVLDCATPHCVARAIGPLVDAHHHLWDLGANQYPWLQNQRVPAHFGDYSAMCRSYLFDNLFADAGPFRLLASVHVEAHWRGGVDPVGETVWLAEHTAQTGHTTAIIGHADLTADSLGEVLDGHMRFAAFRGIRVMSTRSGMPRRDDMFDDNSFRRGFAAAAERGLTIDLQAFPGAHRAVARLARDFPTTRIAVTHCGLPVDRTARGLDLWRAGIGHMAKEQNIYVKLSGLPMTDWQWSVDSFAPLVGHVVDCFGPKRTMFGSNFPVDGLHSEYPALVAGYYNALPDRKSDTIAAIFRETATEFYRLADLAGRSEVRANG